MSAELAASYDHATKSARRAASNFHFAFYLLPRPKRLAMCALYAYLRHTDDLGDCDAPAAERRAKIESWRAQVERALAGEPTTDPVLPALVDTAQRYAIPHAYLLEVIDGVAMDLDVTRYATYAELEQYSYRVASVVGLACIHVWGFKGDDAPRLAHLCGQAFQLTNILRDLKEDAARGRIYLPLEDLARFDYAPEQLLAGTANEQFEQLVLFEVERCEGLYRGAAPLVAALTPEGRRAFVAMHTTYYRLLEKIRQAPADVLRTRARLSKVRKLSILVQAALGRPAATRATAPREPAKKP